MLSKYRLILISLVFSVLLSSCVEEIGISSLSYDRGLVVEGRITNENKYHTITLSQTYMIDSVRVSSVPEENAIVQIQDNADRLYNFIEESPGVYKSEDIFAAEENNYYNLKIKRFDGREYESRSEQLTNKSEITAVNYSLRESESDGEVVDFKVTSNSQEGESHYYLYEYEETYLVYASKWTFEQFDLDSGYPPTISVELKDYNHQYCYKTQYSNNLKQAETVSLGEDKVEDLIIRTIPLYDAAIAERYSILVKQYVQSLDAYNYYQKLQVFSEPSDVFSETQVGFIEGNVFSKTNSNENVVGFFEVSSVSSKRIFVDRIDITERTYNYDCVPIAPLLYETFVLDGFNDVPPLIEFLDLEEYILLYANDAFPPHLPGPYVLTPIECGDCTALGDLEKPSFWID